MGSIFREGDDDVGENRTYPMKINLKDNNPVQLNYSSVARNLYNELKMYIEDLVSKKSILVHPTHLQLLLLEKRMDP